MKFTAKYTRESYVDIEADTVEDAERIALEYANVEENADFWDLNEVKESE